MSSRGHRQNDGDWTCPECGNVNFARRMQCNRCGVERKFEVKKVKKGGIEIGKQAAEKSKGLFSADDWMCKTCGNVNWARRGDCNMCNTPKVNVQEERTGYGGGFNEREGVQYKEKEDSDGEFDEFGRKKRKFRTKSAEAEQKVVSQYDVSDEEESGDDEDASKYDLEADDDDDDGGDASKYDLAASDDNSSRSRSRSRSSSRRSSSRSSSRSRSRSRSSDRYSKERRRKRHYGRSRSKSRSRSRSPHHRNSHSSSSSKRDRHR